MESLMPGENNFPPGKPAVVGLGGFGLTMIIQQLHNLELCGLGPVIACGTVFGGVVQLLAGFAEQKRGDNFHYAFFTAYGTFWLAYSIILLFNKLGVFVTSDADMGCLLIVWTLYTIILWGASLFIHGVMSSTFSLLVLGLTLMDLAHFGHPAMGKVAAFVLIFSALHAWYMMAHILFLDIFGRDVLPVGDPWLNPRPAAS
jgi:succinate-acetate transporter protein